jgi:hypothetical protein
MPINGGFYYSFWEEDVRLWERCRQQAAAQMVAEGWNPRAGKFDEVMRRRARRIWRSHR